MGFPPPGCELEPRATVETVKELRARAVKEMYARGVLPQLLDDITSELDKRGCYMEKESMRLKRADFEKLEK